MLTRIRNRHPIGLIAVGVVITLALSGTAMAVTDASFSYSTTQTGYLTIHAMDLSPADNYSAQVYSTSAANGSLTTSGLRCFSTGVNLPHLSRVSSVQTYYSSTASSSGYYMVRDNMATDVQDFIAGRTIENTGGVRTTSTATVPSTFRTVRNNLYSYGFGVCLDVGSFEGARITYTYTTAGD